MNVCMCYYVYMHMRLAVSESPRTRVTNSLSHLIEEFWEPNSNFLLRAVYIGS